MLSEANYYLRLLSLNVEKIEFESNVLNQNLTLSETVRNVIKELQAKKLLTLLTSVCVLINLLFINFHGQAVQKGNGHLIFRCCYVLL